MKNISLKSKNIGTSIISENAHIDAVNGKIINRENTEKELIETISSKCDVALNNKSKSMSEEDILHLAEFIIKSIDQLEKEKDENKRKNIIKKILIETKSIFGVTTDILESVFKLATLFEVK